MSLQLQNFLQTPQIPKMELPSFLQNFTEWYICQLSNQFDGQHFPGLPPAGSIKNIGINKGIFSANYMNT